MIDEQKQPENNPIESEQNLNPSEKIEKEEFGQPNASASQPEAAPTTETSFQDTIGAAGEAELPESEKITELPEPAQIIKALNQENESLKQQLEQQNQQVDALKKRYISLAAEFDNFRKRTQKEKEELEVQVKCKTIGELLQVVDNFERARTQIKPANEGEMAIHKSYQGVYKNLVDGLKRLGVSAMRPEGQPFDPNYHEAMLREQTDEHPEGTVLEQLVRGYTLGDRVLRHAMVKVAAPKEPTITSAEETTEKENLENQES